MALWSCPPASPPDRCAPTTPARCTTSMVEAQAHDVGEPAIDLEDIVGDWQRPSFDLATQRGRGHRDGEARRLRGGLERPVRATRPSRRPPRPRDRDLAGALDPDRGASSGRSWSGCRCRRAALATGCSSGSATTSPGRPGCSSCRPARVIEPQPLPRATRCESMRRARSATRTRSSRTPSTSGRTGAGGVRGLGGRRGPAAGVRARGTCASSPARAAPSSGVGYVFLSRDAATSRPRRSSRPARAGPRAGPARRLLRGGAGARRVTLRAVHGLPHRCARPRRARRYAGHLDLGPPRHRTLTVSRRRRPCWRCRRAGGTSPSTPRVYFGSGGVNPVRAAPASSSSSTSRSSVAAATSRRMRSPSRTNAIGPPSTASGATWPTHSPVVPPENRPSVSSSTSLPRPGALDRAGDGEHLAHARAALGALVADDDDVAGLDRAVLDGVHRGPLAVEDPRGALEDVGVEAGRLHDGPLGGERAGEDGDPAGAVDRLAHRAQHLAVEVGRGDVGEVLGHRPAGDGEAVAVQQAGIQQGPHDDGHAADAVDVGHDVASRTA